MGVSIRYKGRLKDPTNIRELRDFLLGFADQVRWECLNLTGQDESDLLEIILYPPAHCDPVFFLVGSEGRLHPPGEADPDKGEDLWCSVKTEYGPAEAHIQIVELLGQLRGKYIPDLEVRDEGHYWETANLARLHCARDFLGRQVALFARHLERHGVASVETAYGRNPG